MRADEVTRRARRVWTTNAFLMVQALHGAPTECFCEGWRLSQSAMKCDCFWGKTQTMCSLSLEPRVCVGSVRDCVAVCTWTTATRGWEKHAVKMRREKRALQFAANISLVANPSWRNGDKCNARTSRRWIRGPRRSPVAESRRAGRHRRPFLIRHRTVAHFPRTSCRSLHKRR